jgi:hypothetical protein
MWWNFCSFSLSIYLYHSMWLTLQSFARGAWRGCVEIMSSAVSGCHEHYSPSRSWHNHVIWKQTHGETSK